MVIRFFASIRNITGVKELDWIEAAPTLGDLLRLLSDRYGTEFGRWVLDGDALGSSVMVVVNGNDARHQGGLATKLTPTDVVSILPIMAGGTASVRQPAISGQVPAISRQLLARTLQSHHQGTKALSEKPDSAAIPDGGPARGRDGTFPG